MLIVTMRIVDVLLVKDSGAPGDLSTPYSNWDLVVVLNTPVLFFFLVGYLLPYHLLKDADFLDVSESCTNSLSRDGVDTQHVQYLNKTQSQRRYKLIQALSHCL